MMPVPPDTATSSSVCAVTVDTAPCVQPPLVYGHHQPQPQQEEQQQHAVVYAVHAQHGEQYDVVSLVVPAPPANAPPLSSPRPCDAEGAPGQGGKGDDSEPSSPVLPRVLSGRALTS